MQRAENWLRLWRRADTRAVVVIGFALVLALSVQAFFLYRFAAVEELERADHWLEQTRELVLSLASQELSDEALLRAAHAAMPGGMRATRLLGTDGHWLSEGDWPEPRALTPARRGHGPNRGFGAFLLLRSDRFLVDSIELPDRRRLELALPLKRFAGEAGEIAVLLAALVLLSSVAAFGAALFATRRAFAPLRAGTALLRRIDARNLTARLPTRSTGDPVDRHAETLNTVLAGIGASFERLRRFGSDVAHELRTPLNRIRNAADVALASGRGEDLTGALERIQGSTDELGRMVEALLLIAEVDDQRVPLKPEGVDVDAWLRHTAESWGPVFEEHGATLVLHSAAGSIEADRALLDRVLADGGLVYRTHGFGFVYTRHGDGHTWDPGLDYFARDPVRTWNGLPPYEEFGAR
jgi:hypothetical protein